ncbi:MAG: hypothetical protein HYX27_24240 [Acidobacteria bacterium]|nr:hypothetical protein [Acidobacteriota bacterium]
MHIRRLITFLLGVWFTMVVTIGVVASTTFKVATYAAKSPPGEPARALFLIGEPMTEKLFRFIAAEINRTMFETSGLIELGLVFAIVSLLFLQNYSRLATTIAGVLLLAACASHFLLTPQVVALGRILDFRAEGMMVQERTRFANLHMAYGLLTIFRLACGVWITGIFLNRRSRRRNGQKIEVIDDADNGHVDG